MYMKGIQTQLLLHIQMTWHQVILTHWHLEDFREVIFKLDFVIDGWGISCEIVLT